MFYFILVGSTVSDNFIMLQTYSIAYLKCSNTLKVQRVSQNEQNATKNRCLLAKSEKNLIPSMNADNLIS